MNSSEPLLTSTVEKKVSEEALDCAKVLCLVFDTSSADEKSLDIQKIIAAVRSVEANMCDCKVIAINAIGMDVSADKRSLLMHTGDKPVGSGKIKPCHTIVSSNNDWGVPFEM